MILILNNKMLMAFDRMIDEAIKHGGNPNRIVLSPKEAVVFLKEIRDNSKSKERLIVKKNAIPLITLKIWRTDTVTIKEIYDVVRKWYAKEYTFHFKGVEVVVKKPEVTEPIKHKRGPIKPFNCYGTSSSQDYD